MGDVEPTRKPHPIIPTTSLPFGAQAREEPRRQRVICFKEKTVRVTGLEKMAYLFKVQTTMKMTVMSLLLLLLLSDLVTPLPLGFIAEVVTSTSAVSGVFAPNPRMNGKPMLILISKEGKVSVLEDPDESPSSQTILDLSGNMCTETERGLHSITVHPDFESNPYVYLYYTKYKEGCLADDSENGPWNILTRFKMNNESLVLDYDSREEIWRGAPTQDAVHNGGGILFGNDGKLYLTTGDSGTQENAQDLRTVHGSVIRLNEDGSTPSDNPFSASNGYEAYECKNSEGKVPVNNTSDKAACGEVSVSLRCPNSNPHRRYSCILTIPFLARFTHTDCATRFALQSIQTRRRRSTLLFQTLGLEFGRNCPFVAPTTLGEITAIRHMKVHA